MEMEIKGYDNRSSLFLDLILHHYVTPQRNVQSDTCVQLNIGSICNG